MAEEQKNGFSDSVEAGASAAHSIKGAIKAGKAISGAVKGAAAGGPYGAVAGAVWAGRKHIGKIIAVIIILLLLPVLFSALDLMECSGTLICFDYQADVLRRYCGNRVRFQTIDFIKFERRLFP